MRAYLFKEIQLKLKMVYGVGINDADYQTSGRTPTNWKCEYKKRWDSIMQRSYSEAFHKKNPTYINCSVHPDWRSFMGFRAWMMTQDWEGKQLDKDILISGNKTYGPDTAVFVTPQTNSFILEKGSSRGKYPIGVTWHKRQQKYVSQIGDMSGKPKTLGYFDTPEDAHLRWYEEKKKQAIELARVQTDPRVANALLTRFP